MEEKPKKTSASWERSVLSCRFKRGGKKEGAKAKGKEHKLSVEKRENVHRAKTSWGILSTRKKVRTSQQVEDKKGEKEKKTSHERKTTATFVICQKKRKKKIGTPQKGDVWPTYGEWSPPWSSPTTRKRRAGIKGKKKGENSSRSLSAGKRTLREEKKRFR